MTENYIGKEFTRQASLDTKAFNEQERYVDLSFSSELPVDRYIYELDERGVEVLLHGADNVNLTRIQEMGSGLVNHNPDIIVGRLENVRIEDRRGKARLYFDDDEDGEKYFKKVKSGSLKGVSVRWSVEGAVLVPRDKSFEGIDGPAICFTKWTPLEVSLTPIPADADVGVGRSKKDTTYNQTLLEVNEMDEQKVREMIAAAIDPINKTMEAMPKTIVDQVRAVLIEDSKPKMKITAEVFQELLGRAAAVSIECKSKISDMAVEGKTEGEMLRFITDEAMKGADASDSGDNGDSLENPNANKRTFDKLSDDDLFAGLKNPSMSIN